MKIRISGALRNELWMLEADTYDTSDPGQAAKGAFVAALKNATRALNGTDYIVDLDDLACSYAVGRTGAFENSLDIWRDAPDRQRHGWIRSAEAILKKLRAKEG